MPSLLFFGMRLIACALVLLVGCAESSIGIFDDGGRADARDGGGRDSAGCPSPLAVPEPDCFFMEGAACLRGSDPVRGSNADGCLTYACPEGEVLACMCPAAAPPQTCHGFAAGTGECEETLEIPSEEDLCGLECPEGTEPGGCPPECELDEECTLGFSECCGACVDDVGVVARSFDREDDFLSSCDECDCDLDGSFRFEQALPVCSEEGSCVASPFDTGCSENSDCELVRTMGEDGRCGPLMALPSAEAERVLERYGTDAACGREGNVSAACTRGVCIVLRTAM